MNFPLDSVTELPDESKMMLTAALEQMQVRDSLRMYNNLIERCFKECAEDMRSKTLSAKEEQCAAKCTEKFINVQTRVGTRFQEFFAQMEQAAAEQMTRQAGGSS